MKETKKTISTHKLKHVKLRCAYGFLPAVLLNNHS